MSEKQLGLFDSTRTRAVHANSVAAYSGKETKNELGKRALDILTEVRTNGPGTDRQISDRMKFPNRSYVQPRISDLVRLGHLKEQESIHCPVTGKKVRVVSI